MKIQSIKIILLLLVFLTASFLALYIVNKSGKYRNTDTAMNRILLKFFNSNNVTIEAGVSNNIFVAWRSGGHKNYVIKQGEKTGSIKNIKGVQVFEIFKNDKLICTITQVKTAWWHTHDYNFKVEEDNKCLCTIKGPDTEYTVK